jgi:hypothetical protein
MGIVVPGRKTFHTRQTRSADILPALRKTPVPRPSEQKNFKQAAGGREDREETRQARFWEAARL